MSQTRPLTEIVRGVTDPQMKKDLYVLAFTIVRADETVWAPSASTLHSSLTQLGLDTASVTSLEAETSANIDSSGRQRMDGTNQR